jgi:hypothetical protein
VSNGLFLTPPQEIFKKKCILKGETGNFVEKSRNKWPQGRPSRGWKMNVTDFSSYPAWRFSIEPSGCYTSE